MPDIAIINPEAMGPPLSLYGQIARCARLSSYFISGQLATDLNGRVVGKDNFDAQMKEVLSNIEKALKSVEASFANVVQLYDLSGALAGHREFPARSRRVVPHHVPDTSLPAEHAFRGRSARPRGFSHRNRDDCSTLRAATRSRRIDSGGERTSMRQAGSNTNKDRFCSAAGQYFSGC